MGSAFEKMSRRALHECFESMDEQIKENIGTDMVVFPVRLRTAVARSATSTRHNLITPGF